MKKALTCLAIILGILVILALCFFLVIRAIWSSDLDLTVTKIAREASPDGRYEVVIEQLGEAQWSFGSVTARITVMDLTNRKSLASFKEEVANDGGGLYASQFTVAWSDDSVKIVIDPQESPDIEYTAALPS